MNLFRAFLFAFLALFLLYSVIVIANEDTNLFVAFFGPMAQMTWAGQFNLDFSGFLLLSALWTLWRNEFTATAWILGLLAFFGGMVFLTIYLLYLSFREQGDIKTMLLGRSRQGSSD